MIARPLLAAFALTAGLSAAGSAVAEPVYLIERRPPPPRVYYSRRPMCPRVYAPVCGLRYGQRINFTNACLANASGAVVAHRGRCIY